MKRRLEPELMEDIDQVDAYASADFTAANTAFVEALFERLGPLPAEGRLLDLGCGPADILMRLAPRLPNWELTGVDGSGAMLSAAMDRLVDLGLCSQISLLQARIPNENLGDGYDLLTSNSLLHHLPDPQVLWTELRRLGAPGAAMLIMDLRRPPDEVAAQAIVDRWSPDEPEILRRDFFNSLLAAFTPEEVEAQLLAANLPLIVEAPTDRHLLVYGRLPC